MAYMLGGKYCVESLHRDVSDLQSAVADTLSRVGPVRYPSWKFPDKISSDVNIEELLEEHAFSEDTEDNQVAHIILFELVIDRMMLLLQSFTRFVEQLIQGTAGRPPTATSRGSQMSIGLVVKKFWNKMVQLNNITHKLHTENKSKGSIITKLEVINFELQEQVRRTTRSVNMPNHFLDSRVAFVPDGDSDDQETFPAESAAMLKMQMKLSPQPSVQQTVAIDTRTVASQTLETSFVPCEACERVQLCLREVGKAIMEVCQSQKLPSSIARHIKMPPGDVMSAMDITRWTAEQSKDLDRIKNHLGDLMAKINPLELELADSTKICEKLSQDVMDKEKDLKKERGSCSAVVKQQEAKLKEIERQHAESIMVVKRSYEEARSRKKKMEDELVKLKRELQRQHEALKELDVIREELSKTLDENTTNQAVVDRLESHVTQLSSQLKETQELLTNTSRHLGKEQAKNRSIDKHGQALQNKHDALVQRVDELDQECQDLRDGLADAEDSKEEVMEQLKTTQEELKGLQENLKTQKELVASITEEKGFLESSVGDLQTMILTLEDQLKETQEREKMLVMYPDSNPGLIPASRRPNGDSATDMGQQVQTNNVRIQILEEQNNLLRKNIDRLLCEQPQKHYAEVTGPAIPLWQTDSVKQARQSVSITNRYNTNVRSPRSPRTGHHESRQSNGHAANDHHNEREVLLKYGGQDRRSRHYSPSSDDAGRYQMLPRPPSQKGNREKSRPKSGKRSSTNSSLHAYRSLKNSGAINSQSAVLAKDTPDFFVGNGPSSKDRRAWVTPDPDRADGTRSKDSQYQPMETYICPQCDKMYNNERDLDIHKSYCYP